MDENSGSLPRPKFETKGTNKNRIYCQICLVCCVAKHQATRKLEKNSGNVNLKTYAEKWRNNNHKCNKVFGFVDCQNSFFFPVFLSRTFTIHRTVGEGGGYLLTPLYFYFTLLTLLYLHIASSRTRTGNLPTLASR